MREREDIRIERNIVLVDSKYILRHFPLANDLFRWPVIKY